MPYKYTRKTQKASWSQDELENALRSIEGGVLLRTVARNTGIPRGTLRSRMKKHDHSAPKMGRKSVFDKRQEAEIVSHILSLANIFYGITPLRLRRLAFEFAERNNILNNFNKASRLAGKDWLAGFMRRNPQVSLRKPEATSLNRIRGFNKTEVSKFFSNLLSVYEKYRFPPEKIFNFDETGISVVQNPGKILAKKGQKQVGSATSAERGRTVTVCCAFSASGTYIPPLFIYARSRMSEQLKKNGPPGAKYECSKSGWITEEIFIKWLQHFVENVKSSAESPVLLIMDNHSSHSSLAAYNFCRSNNIVVVTIPPHTSHRLQPLDITFYGPLKTAFNRECDLYLRAHGYTRITEYDLAALFNSAYCRVATIEKAINGFRHTGIFPLNPDIFSEEDFAPQVYENAPSAVSQESIVDKPIPPRDATLNLDNQKSQSSCSLQLTSAKNLDDQKSQPSCSLQLTPAKKSATESSSSLEISVSEILPIPIPGPSGINKRNIKQKKEHSSIMTSTSLKDYFEEKETKKKNKGNKKLEQGKINKTRSKKTPVSKKSGIKRKVFESSSSSEDIDLKKICDDDELDDIDGTQQEECIICGEFGKDKELWWRCTVCGEWVHSDCARALSPKNYVCDFCA